MLNRWNSQNSLVKLSYERVTTSRFPAGSILPAAAGSSMVRRYKAKTNDNINEEKGVVEPVQVESVQPETLPWDLNAADEMENFGRPMSSRTARKVREKITAMYEVGIAKTFVTLGFVADCSDALAVQVLAKMLREWRKEWGQFNFLWVIEHQENGRPHFHLVLDRTIEKSDIKKFNARWVRMQYNSGIVYRVKSNAKLYEGKEFDLNPLHISPAQIAGYVNPFDIEYVYSSQGLRNYLAGYVTKSIGDNFKCQTWHCSRGVSRLFTEVMTAPDTHRDLLQDFPGCKNVYVYKKDVIDKKTGKVKRKAGDMVFPQDYSNEFCSWVYIVNAEGVRCYTTLITDLNKEVVRGEFEVDKKILYYNYEQYAREFFNPVDYGYKLYKKVVHNYDSGDAYSYKNIEERKLNFENDFYQYAKAMRGRGLFSVYCDHVYITPKGQRFYNGKYFNQEDFIKEINHHKKLNHAYN